MLAPRSPRQEELPEIQACMPGECSQLSPCELMEMQNHPETLSGTSLQPELYCPYPFTVWETEALSSHVTRLPQ